MLQTLALASALTTLPSKGAPLPNAEPKPVAKDFAPEWASWAQDYKFEEIAESCPGRYRRARDLPRLQLQRSWQSKKQRSYNDITIVTTASIDR